MSDPIVVKCYERSLRQSDIDLLAPPNWLNDRIVGLYLEYLKEVLFKDHKNVLGYVCPETAHLLKFTNCQEVEEIVDNLELRKKKIIVLPINDCMEEMAPGGSHWSLLAYEASKEMFIHYDSVSCSKNIEVAEHTSKVLCGILKLEECKIQHVIPSLQRNSYDCGVHCLCNTEGVLKRFLTEERRPLQELVDASEVEKARGALKALVESLKKKMCLNN